MAVWLSVRLAVCCFCAPGCGHQCKIMLAESICCQCAMPSEACLQAPLRAVSRAQTQLLPGGRAALAAKGLLGRRLCLWACAMQAANYLGLCTGNSSCEPTEVLSQLQYSTQGPGKSACSKGQDVVYPLGAPGFQDDPTGASSQEAASKVQHPCSFCLVVAWRLWGVACVSADMGNLCILG